MQGLDQLHFIGIGGVGMSALAQIFLSMGHEISGCDLRESAAVKRLQDQGATVHIGHDESHVHTGQTVIISTAINEGNPEYQAARALSLPIMHRADLLKVLLSHFHSIAITGTHGKTTTTTMAYLALNEAGLSPTVAVGGEVPQLSSNAILGKGNYFVAEVDESDQSIRRLTANIAIVTNLEADHLDHYKDLNEIIDAVVMFSENMPADGVLIVCADDAGNREMMTRVNRRVITYGLESPADYRAEGIQLRANGSTFRVYHGEDYLGEFTLPIAGVHNVSNALSVIALAHHLGADLFAVGRAFASYGGVARRFQLIGEVNGVSVIDDYAHHPSEIRATLAAASLHKRPITAVFQPHRFSRTKALLPDFAQAFASADRVIISEIYGAGEDRNRFDVSGEQLARLIKLANPHKPVYFLPHFEAIMDYLQSNPVEDEMVLMLGAGDITQLSRQLIERLSAQKVIYASERRSKRPAKASAS